MAIKFKFKIKNWKLAWLALIFIVFFTSLGFWQLSRATYKQRLFCALQERQQHAPLSANDLNNANDWRFYRAALKGRFDNQHTFLLDNKTYHRQVGYEVYTPFHAQGLMLPILIDRGFIPITADRSILPKINDIIGDVTITGMINTPPLYMALGQISDGAQSTWPRRIEFINLADLSDILKQRLYPYTLTMSPKDARAYQTEWTVVTMPPERHLGYAVQWFALALTLLILFVALNRSK